MSELVELLDKVVLGQDGFKLGEPWTPSDNSLGAVVPIIRHTDHEKDYYTLPEVKDRVELEDTGIIEKVKLSAKGVDKPIVVLAGEVFEGQGTQSRGVVHSIVVMPSEVKPIETRCVHATHGVRTHAKFTPVGLAPPKVAYKLMSGNQHSVWMSVSSYASYAMSTAASPRPATGGQWSGMNIVSMDSLPKAMKLVESKISEYLEKVPCFENQVGAIIIGLNGVEGIEMFDHPEAWEARYKDVMGKYADSITRESSLFRIDKESCIKTVEEFLTSLKGAEVEVLHETEMFRVMRIRAQDYVGEAVVLMGRIVHLFAIRRDSEDKDRTPIGEFWTNIGTTYQTYTPSTYQTYTPSEHQSWLTTDPGIHKTKSICTTSVPHFKTEIGTNTPKGYTTISNRKGWDTVIQTLKSHPEGLTWTELQRETGLNSATLTNRLKEAKSIGVISESIRANGRKVYRLI